jgi:hypothetical protein
MFILLRIQCKVRLLNELNPFQKKEDNNHTTYLLILNSCECKIHTEKRVFGMVHQELAAKM